MPKDCALEDRRDGGGTEGCKMSGQEEEDFGGTMRKGERKWWKNLRGEWDYNDKRRRGGQESQGAATDCHSSRHDGWREKLMEKRGAGREGKWRSADGWSVTGGDADTQLGKEIKRLS